jgi:hypothetical protein
MAERVSRGQMKMLEAKKLAIVGFAIAIQAACAKDQDPQVIHSAPPSPLSSHLRNCAAKSDFATSGSAEVVIREAALVCRKVADGSTQDVPLEPRFQVLMTPNRALELSQNIVIRIEDSSTKERSPERSLIEEKVVQFLQQQCRPAIDQIFRRSGLRANHQFRILREGESYAAPGPIARMNTPRVGSSRSKPAPVSPATEAFAAGGFHLLLDVIYLREEGIVLKDDPSGSLSGSLSVRLKRPTVESEKMPSPTSTELDDSQLQGLQFCGQIAMRVAENYGLTKGRDCQALSNQAASTSETEIRVETGEVKKMSKTAVGLMKAGRRIGDLKQVKLASDEIDEVFSPVCGKMSQTINQR